MFRIHSTNSEVETALIHEALRRLDGPRAGAVVYLGAVEVGFPEEEPITQPETGDFDHGSHIEAEYQRQLWKDTDPRKTDADWFWTLGFIAGKALHPGITLEKKLHRIEAAAGMLRNWHAAVKADRGQDGS